MMPAALVFVCLAAEPPLIPSGGRSPESRETDARGEQCLPGAKVIKRDSVEQCVTADGKLHGLVRVKSETTGKVILEQRWVDDRLDGQARGWHDNGKLESESFYKAGKPDGAWREWWPNGVLASEAQYKAGVRVGTAALYYESGRPAWKRTFDAKGKLLGEATFDEQGQRDTKAEGELSRGVIARVIQAGRAALRYCYEAQLQKLPKLAGSLRVDFEIGPSGAVQGAKLAESSLHNEAAERCVVKGVEKIEFPRPLQKEPLAISFPFHFRGASIHPERESRDKPPDAEE